MLNKNLYSFLNGPASKLIHDPQVRREINELIAATAPGGGSIEEITNTTRPESPVVDKIYLNTDSGKYERYHNGNWEDAAFSTFPTPTTPASISGTAGDTEIDVTFASSTNAVSYEVQTSSNNFSSIAVYSTGSSSPITVVGLTNGTAYLSRVRGVSARGVKGAWVTDTVPVTPEVPLPGGDAPILQSISIEDNDKQSVKLHYDSALDNTSVPMASAFSLGGGVSQFITGTFPAQITGDRPVTLLPNYTHPTTASFGSTVGDLAFINMWKWSRVRDTALITKIKFYVGDLTNVTSIKFNIWRPSNQSSSGSAHNRQLNQEILNLLTANSLNTITLPTPILVREADKTGMSVTTSGSIGNVFAIEPLTVGSDIRNGMWYAGTSVTSQSQTWSSAIYNDGFVPIELISATGPDMVMLGDSWIQGFSGFAGYVNPAVNDNAENVAMTLSFQLSALLNISVANYGINGQTSGQIKARIADVIAQNPRMVYLDETINGGATFFQDYVDMVTTLVAAGIQVYVGGMGPSTAQGNSAIANNTLSRPQVEAAGAIWVDVYPLLDDGAGHIDTPYAGDGNHPNQSGNALIASAIADAIRAHTPVTISGSDVIVRANRKFSFTDFPTFNYTVPSTLNQRVRTGVGADAAAIISGVVDNNIVLAAEDLFFNVVDQFGESSANIWVGSWGQADKVMPEQGVSWVGVMPGHVGGVNNIFFTDNPTAINSFDVNNPSSFSKGGMTVFNIGGTNYVCPFDFNGSNVMGLNAITTHPYSASEYYSIYKDGVDVYLAYSTDNITWTTFYKFVRTFNSPVYVYAYSGASYPAGYALVPFGTADTTAPTIKNTVEVIDSHALIIEADEPLSVFTTAGWIPKRGGVAMTVTSVETIPSHTLSKKYRYQLIVSNTILITDTVTLDYDSSIGATADAHGNEIISFTGKAVANNIKATALDGNSVALLKTISSSNNLYASHGVFSEVSDATDRANGLLSVYLPAATDGFVYYDKVSDEDAVLIAFKTKDGILPVDYTDAASGVGYFLGSAAYSFVNGSFAQVIANNIGFPWRLYRNSGNDNIYLQLWNGSAYSTWHNMAIPAGDLDVVIYVVQGYPKNITQNGMV